MGEGEGVAGTGYDATNCDKDVCVWVGWGLESRPVLDAWECGYDVTNCGRD